jgi:UDP-N-acetylmuramate: L-alanyl-gamma-D-glutamyl-meso-diaminopimelate ligase
LGTFENVKRRMEVRGTVALGGGTVTIYDDFAHHPTAIRTTVDGLKRRIGPDERILAVFEPRSNTMKLGVMKDRLAHSLRGADRVFCYTRGLSWDARLALGPLGALARCEDDLTRLVEAVAQEARSGDQVLIMSNGGFGGIHEKLLAALGVRGR